MQKQKVGFIIGPTASGKTALSVELAQRMNAAIVSADSMQIYRGMDIGSAKPTLAERQGVTHYLLDVAKPLEPFSVADYQRMAAEAIEDIAKADKLPLVVGGTGLYINALTYPLRFAAPADQTVRDALAEEERLSPGCLYARLRELDPQSAARLHPNDKKRITRALEVYRLTGRTLSAQGGDFSNTAGEDIPYIPHMLGLSLPRDILYERINARVDVMMEQGLLDEVQTLRAQGCTPDSPAMQGLGYKQLMRHLQGELTLAEAVEAIKQETRHFAKRQMTWFRRDARIRWLDALMPQETLLQRARHILETGED